MHARGPGLHMHGASRAEVERLVHYQIVKKKEEKKVDACEAQACLTGENM